MPPCVLVSGLHNASTVTSLYFLLKVSLHKGHILDVTHALCRIYGDPHIHTFDGKKIDFQGGCEYVAVQSVNPNLTITIELDKPATRITSSLKTITVQSASESVTLRGTVTQVKTHPIGCSIR